MARTNRTAEGSPDSRRAALEVRALAKDYPQGLFRRRRRVLAHIDLELEPGASLGLIGPNGSGKSTLLRILAGIEAPTAGTVAVFGAPVAERAARRRIGYLPDGFPFPEELSPRATLTLLGGLSGLARAERARASERMLERVGLAADARRPMARFSQGMRRRFALAQAFLHAPDLVLLDEPTAGLDAQGYLVLEELLGEARARGAALLFATHVLSDLRDQCEHACVLVQGAIAARGPTREILSTREALLALYRSATAGRAGSEPR